MQAMMRTAIATERRRVTIGFVASVMYARLPALIREFRKALPNVELNLVENTTFEQIAALKDGRIDMGFGRIRFDDHAVRRTILRNEPLVAAVPLSFPHKTEDGPISLAELAKGRLILYPSKPRPSYADQVLSHFGDNGIEPAAVTEARELQIALGLVAAEDGYAIIPESVSRARQHDVRCIELVEQATSPIIMSHRVGDFAPEIMAFKSIIARKYSDWGYPVPAVLVGSEPALPDIPAK